jgi:hypothetical protein
MAESRPELRARRRAAVFMRWMVAALGAVFDFSWHDRFQTLQRSPDMQNYLARDIPGREDSDPIENRAIIGK